MDPSGTELGTLKDTDCSLLRLKLNVLPCNKSHIQLRNLPTVS